ncbi:MAG: hypothetical protein J2P37_31050 [Ktedonobacteraceae bacterium]|nr:hypothetical protein [Ktedonobacteraceae bacterium]
MRNNLRSFYIRWLVPLIVLLALATAAVLTPFLHADAKGTTAPTPGIMSPNGFWFGS